MLILYAFLLIYVRRADLVIEKHESEERELHEERIKYISENDHLTGLPNRQSLINLLEKLFKRAKINNSQIFLIYVDIHRFKLINDSLGHDVGDKVLVEVAARISSTIRNTSLIGRAGPDEFLIAIENLPLRVFDGIVTRLIRSLTETYIIGSANVNLSVSIGIVSFPNDADDAQSAIKSAEAAVLRAKELGKNRFAYFTNELNRKAVERFDLESDLNQALEKNQFEVFYQPRVNTRGETVSAEALIRWRKEDGQLISPALFIHVLEDTELIVPVGYWVLLNACKECVKWHAKGFKDLSVSVNLSMRQFANGHIIDNIRKALLVSGLNAESLELELTETLFAENPDETLSILKAIKSFGIKISLDDFGTGYSSLSYLMKYPIDCLKIDKSFVRDITSNRDQSNLTQSIINMAQALNMTTVAEGVEEEDQRDLLIKLGTHQLQGFLFSRPLSADDFLEYLN
jgi:diguanylate cyclase (GGDEF)-like protein